MANLLFAAVTVTRLNPATKQIKQDEAYHLGLD